MDAWTARWRVGAAVVALGLGGTVLPARAGEGEPEAAAVLAGKLAEAEACYRSKSYGAALKVLEESVKLDAKCFEAHFKMGLCFESLDNTQAAADAFQKAVAITPDHLDATARLGSALVKLGKVGEALPPLEKVYAATPDAPGVREALGRIYFEKGDLEKAREHLRKLLRDGTKEADLVYLHGECLYRLEKYEDALEDLKKAADLARGNPKWNAVSPKAEKRAQQAEARVRTLGAIEEGGRQFRNKAYHVTLQKPPGYEWAWLFPKPLPERMVFAFATDDDGIHVLLDSYPIAKSMTYTIGGKAINVGQIKDLRDALESEFKLGHRDVKPGKLMRVLPQFKKQESFVYVGVRKADLKKIETQVTAFVEGSNAFYLRIVADEGRLEKSRKDLEKILGSVKFLEK